MAKVDLHSVYRSVGIRPAEYCLTGFSWRLKGHEGTYFFDSRLPFWGTQKPFNFQPDRPVSETNDATPRI